MVTIGALEEAKCEIIDFGIYDSKTVYSSEIGQLNQFYLCAGTGAFWTPVPVLFGQASSGFRMYLFEIFQFLLLPPIVTDFLMHASAN